MPLPDSFYGMITQESVRMLRNRELLLFCLGYAFNQLRNICHQFNRNDNNRFMTPLHKIADQFITSTIRQSKIVQKEKIATIFSFVLNVFQQSRQKLGNLSFSFQELTEFFLEIVVESLKIKEQTHQSTIESLKAYIHKAIQVKSVKSNLIIDERKDSRLVFEYNDCSGLKSDYENSKIETVEKIENLCQICYVPLQTQKIYDQNINKRETVKISSCNHQYHQKCMLQMIGHHMNENSSILQQNERTHTNQAISIERTTLTLLKCPGYEECSVHLNFSQVHNILLNHQGQNGLYQLDRLYSMAFNDYINAHNIMPFNKLSEAIEEKCKSQQLAKFNPGDYLFFCQTKGCNAIYEIKENSVDQNFFKQASNDRLQNFTCLSCSKSYCLECFSDIHPTMTCKEFAISSSYLPEDRELEKFIKTLRRPYMKCPKCHFYVDNWRGCSTITCRCGIRFCYKCGSTECPYAKCLKQMAKQGKMNVQNQESEK